MAAKENSGSISSASVCVSETDNVTLVQFFYTEFFGAFVPGVVSVGVAFGIVFHAAKAHGLVDEAFTSAAIELGFRPYAFVFLLFLAYVVGAIVYRRTHDAPDAASCFRIMRKAHGNQERLDRFAFHAGSGASKLALASFASSAWRLCAFYFALAFRPENAFRRLGDGDSRPDCEYPYPYYRRYLLQRGMGHLAKYVRWCRGSGNAASAKPNGKLFINVAKQRNGMQKVPRKNAVALIGQACDSGGLESEMAKLKSIASAAWTFFRKNRATAPNPVVPLPRTEQHDALLSVWNVFRNRKQRTGFLKNGRSGIRTGLADFT